MAVQQSLDILIGHGTLYYAPTGTANPDETTVAYGAAWGGSWVDFGELVEGQAVNVSMEEDTAVAYGEQSAYAHLVSRTRREAMITATLMEHSAASLAVLLQGTAATTAAGASQKGYTDIPFGAPTNITVRKFGVEALRVDSAGVNQPIRWFFHRGIIRMASPITYAKQNPTGIAIEIRLLGDSSQTAGEELGIYQVVTAAATA